jgi:pyruvyl transferase EpsO
MKDHRSLMLDLQKTHEPIFDLLKGRKFHYIDIPVHDNIGDLLIMQGTLAFFKKNQLSPETISSASAFMPEWVKPGEVLVFHGGGNFGDLYPYFQQLRERVTAAKPGNRIVILPQSFHFSSPEKLAESAAIFRSHPDLHICVRDKVSLEQARAFTDNVYLLPDMAHQLYPLGRGGYDKHGDAMLITRVDDEKVDHGTLPDVRVSTHTDWPQFVGARERNIHRIRRVHDAFARRGMGRMANGVMSPLWIWYAKRLVDDAIRMFAQHNLVVTDRLHGHILAVLMDMPTMVLDNSYGKNSRYAAVWTARSRLVTLLAAARSA